MPPTTRSTITTLIAASHQPRPVFAGSILARVKISRARSSMLAPPVAGAFNKRLHDEGCDREQHEERCHGKCADKVVLVVENLDVQRHRISQSADVARDDGDRAE